MARLAPRVHQLLCILSLFYFVIYTSSHVTEVILDDDMPPPLRPPSTITAANMNLPYIAASPSLPEEQLCHVEYQVMKRSLGKCIKLGRNLRGCASGNYIQPMHPECM